MSETLTAPSPEPNLPSKGLAVESDQALQNVLDDATILGLELSSRQQEKLEVAAFDHAENIVLSTEIITLADKLIDSKGEDHFAYSGRGLDGLLRGKDGNFTIQRSQQQHANHETSRYSMKLFSENPSGGSARQEDITFVVQNGAISFESLHDKDDPRRIKNSWHGKVAWNSEKLGSEYGGGNVTPDYFEHETKNTLNRILKTLGENAKFDLEKIDRAEAKKAKKIGRFALRK